MLLCEAAEFEKDFRTVLLPGLLEHQQSVQDAFILTWWVVVKNPCKLFNNIADFRKKLLQQVTQLSDLTSEKFAEIWKRVENSVELVNPEGEYKDFTEKHK